MSLRPALPALLGLLLGLVPACVYDWDATWRPPDARADAPAADQTLRPDAPPHDRAPDRALDGPENWPRQWQPLSNPGGFALGSSGAGAGANHAVVDPASGDIFVAGDLFGSLKAGSTTHTSSGDGDLLLARYSPGGALRWARVAGGSKIDSLRALVLGPSDTLYLCGRTSGKFSFDGKTTVGAGLSDLAVAQVARTDGAVRWLASMGSNGVDACRDLVHDAKTKRVYAVGWSGGTISAGGKTVGFKGKIDALAWALDASSGAVIWMTSAGSSGHDVLERAALDASGRLHVAGYVDKAATAGTIVLNPAGPRQFFVGSLTAAGAWRWALASQSVRSEATPDMGTVVPASLNGEARGIALDAQDNVYVAGFGAGEVTLGGQRVTVQGPADAVVARLSSAGTVSWLRALGGAGTEAAEDLALDVGGNPLVAMRGSGPGTYDGHPIHLDAPREMLLLRLSPAGKLLNLSSAQGPDYETPAGISVAGGQVTVAGSFQKQITLGSTTVKGPGEAGFVWQLTVP